ncbi:hypothetical protein [Bacillus sp. SJS]|uniref:hypothetical protein n=1 Tax=Bacillus sp. SJS TaxID=1423321 RepID=UPI0004DD834C|nr:hypothetical protein [Bacillus sp. SJS]KZZ83102.1 hypothetical protein AS29_020155 [Bacillus sp. SJS]
MRDIETFQLSKDEWLVAASDNAGAIGEKAEDQVHAPLETVAKHTLRVALMECMSAGAYPFSIMLHNFNGEQAWERIQGACRELLDEAGIGKVSISGSTESNMKMIQSALGIMVLGKASNVRTGHTPNGAGFAVIGQPLVGSEVLDRKDQMISIPLFLKLLAHPAVYELIPAGSKGIVHEIKILSPHARFIECELDIHKSAGPASCVIMSYDKAYNTELMNVCKGLFHPVSLTE